MIGRGLSRQPNLKKALAEELEQGPCEHLWRRCSCGAVIERCEHKVERPLMRPALRNGCDACKAAAAKQEALAAAISEHQAKQAEKAAEQPERGPRPPEPREGMTARERFEASRLGSKGE